MRCHRGRRRARSNGRFREEEGQEDPAAGALRDPGVKAGPVDRDEWNVTNGPAIVTGGVSKTSFGPAWIAEPSCIWTWSVPPITYPVW